MIMSVIAVVLAVMAALRCLVLLAEGTAPLYDTLVMILAFAVILR